MRHRLGVRDGGQGYDWAAHSEARFEGDSSGRGSRWEVKVGGSRSKRRLGRGIGEGDWAAHCGQDSRGTEQAEAEQEWGSGRGGEA